MQTFIPNCLFSLFSCCFWITLKTATESGFRNNDFYSFFFFNCFSLDSVTRVVSRWSRRTTGRFTMTRAWTKQSRLFFSTRWLPKVCCTFCSFCVRRCRPLGRNSTTVMQPNGGVRSTGSSTATLVTSSSSRRSDQGVKPAATVSWVLLFTYRIVFWP